MLSGLIDLTIPKTSKVVIVSEPPPLTTTINNIINIPLVEGHCSNPLIPNLNNFYTSSPQSSYPQVNGQLYQVDIPNNSSCSNTLTLLNILPIGTINIIDVNIDSCGITPTNLFIQNVIYV